MQNAEAMEIREARPDDFDGIWPIFRHVVEQGETYPYPRDTDYQTASSLWLDTPRRCLVIEDNGLIVGTYYIRDNQPGLGSHVCNCGYMVHADHRRRGIGSVLCRHSLSLARELGYRAMQFNLVVGTNVASIGLWRKLGFSTIGRLPGAFAHPTRGYVDALVMFRRL
jgi:L-amino acid N-acyltransferase YncA